MCSNEHEHERKREGAILLLTPVTLQQDDVGHNEQKSFSILGGQLSISTLLFIKGCTLSYQLPMLLLRDYL